MAGAGTGTGAEKKGILVGPVILDSTPAFGIILEPDGSSHLSAGLDRYAVETSDGDLIAHVFGTVLNDWHGADIEISGRRIVVRGVEDELGFVRKLIHGLHGCFVAVTVPPFGNSVYPDFGGSLPLVFDRVSGRIASSAALLMSEADYSKRLLPDRYERLVRKEGHGWMSGTLTAHDGVERLLPGHALDRATLKARRVWPLAGEMKLGMEVSTAASQAAVALRGFVEAAAHQFRTALTLTAGYDSRILLAASRHVVPQMQFVTFGEADEGIDQHASARLAEEFGLDHALLPIRRASSEQMVQWDHCVGHCMREINREIHPTLLGVAAEVILTGMYGEVGRSRLYRQDIETVNDAPATVDFVLARLTLPADPELQENVAQWLAPLAWMPRSMVLDMAFNELKFGSWAMGQAPAQKALKMAFMPFAQAGVQGAFLQTDPVQKGTERLFRMICEQLWPELLCVPINKYGDLRDRLGLFTKLTNPERVIRYLRDRHA